MDVLQSIPVIPHFFAITYVQNEGAAWGIMAGKTIILTVIAALAIILLNQYIAKEKKFTPWSIWGCGALLGGMIGNLIDRLLHGYVVDFFDFCLLGYDFPVFNLADIAIVMGVFLLILDVIRGEIDEYKSRKRRN